MKSVELAPGKINFVIKERRLAVDWSTAVDRIINNVDWVQLINPELIVNFISADHSAQDLNDFLAYQKDQQP